MKEEAARAAIRGNQYDFISGIRCFHQSGMKTTSRMHCNQMTPADGVIMALTNRGRFISGHWWIQRVTAAREPRGGGVDSGHLGLQFRLQGFEWIWSGVAGHRMTLSGQWRQVYYKSGMHLAGVKRATDALARAMSHHKAVCIIDNGRREISFRTWNRMQQCYA